MQGNVLITGSNGAVGRHLMEKLEALHPGRIFGVDISPTSDPRVLVADLRSEELGNWMQENQIGTVYHLASWVQTAQKGKAAIRILEELNSLDNLMKASLRVGVQRFIFSSSGAVYGYHRDHPRWIHEEIHMRPNDDFPYSVVKAQSERLIQETLAGRMDIFTFRMCTVLGRGFSNQITRWLTGPAVLAVSGSRSPFVFIDVEDVVRCLVAALESDKPGTYNLAGDGAITMRHIAGLQKKPYIRAPAFLYTGILESLRTMGLNIPGKAAVRFIRYRPVISNMKLKREFGFKPTLSSKEVFMRFLDDQRR